MGSDSSFIVPAHGIARIVPASRRAAASRKNDETDLAETAGSDFPHAIAVRHRDPERWETATPNADFEHRFRRCSQIRSVRGDNSDGTARLSSFLLFNDLGT